jgi:hypothetical protein
MPRRIMLSAFVTVVTAMTAGAADLAPQSRLGAIFAEPAEAPPPAYPSAYRSAAFPGPIIPYNLLPNPLWNRGNYYYGSSWSYYNPGPYYGGPYAWDGGRLPYVCGLYGYCN